MIIMIEQLDNIEQLPAIEETIEPIDSDKELFRLTNEIQEAITQDIGAGEKQQVLKIEDASSETARILVGQFGSDPDKLREGIIDVRRFTNISLIDTLWLSWFMNKSINKGGRFARKFCMEYINLCYSINAQNKKIIVGLQQAVTGTGRSTDKQKDKRNFIERHLTKRNQEPDELFNVE